MGKKIHQCLFCLGPAIKCGTDKTDRRGRRQSSEAEASWNVLEAEPFTHGTPLT